MLENPANNRREHVNNKCRARSLAAMLAEEGADLRRGCVVLEERCNGDNYFLCHGLT